MKRIALGLAGLLLCAASYAAVPKSWWNDIANDRADSVQTMLARGTDPNAVSPEGQPAIMQAIRTGSWDVYEVLAKNRKTNLNIANANDETPLMYLAVVGETARAQALIQRGAQVNRLGWTPLQYAASKGHLDTVQMLLANKAIVNAPGPDGTTALMMAALSGKQPVVQALLDAGADPTMVNLKKQDAVFWARLRNHDALADKLEALTKRILAERQAQRASAGTAAQASSTGVDLDAPSPESLRPAAQTDSSTSKYFDLKRFEKE
ncbi:ankyrin repeat domain-containing protein [Parapusillimonas sp. JC17]|uniref:ankyrin repeat domain-containing protein n=1 Tax=Parapusillimonas sp. JC17 TaxID=3445768 RepID=UPI003FA0A7F3